MIKIGIDARPLQEETKYRGIGRSLHFLLKNLYKFSDDAKIIFYIDGKSPEPLVLKLYKNKRVIILKSRKLSKVRHVRALFSKRTQLNPAKGEADVVLQYNAELGIPMRVPSVATFYDTIPIIFKHGAVQNQIQAGEVRKYKKRLGDKLAWRHYTETLKEYKNAKHIISISKSSKNDYERYKIGHTKQNISVVYLGVESIDSNSQIPDRLTKIIHSNKYLLYVGGIDIRKNIAGLLNDFYKLKKQFPGLLLLVAGKEFSLKKELESVGWLATLDTNLKFKNDVHSLGFVSDSELQYLYAHAEAFVFPSRYEGFGLPILEAMQAKCPVVCYDNSSLPEVAGDAALMVPDGESMVYAITQLLEDESLRKSLIKKGLAQAKKFTWEKTAKETLEILIETAKTKAKK
jgi:glycosyltransferase involved in cell wall biosynthesis